MLFDYDLHTIWGGGRNARPNVSHNDRVELTRSVARKTPSLVRPRKKANTFLEPPPNPTLSLTRKSPGQTAQAPRQHVHDDRSAGDGLNGVAADRFVGERLAVDDFGPDRRNQLHLFVGISRVLQIGRTGPAVGPRRFLSNLGGTAIGGRRAMTGRMDRVVAVPQVGRRRVTPKAAGRVRGAGHPEHPAPAGFCRGPEIRRLRGLVVVQRSPQRPDAVQLWTRGICV